MSIKVTAVLDNHILSHNEQSPTSQPKLGLAFSGTAARAITYVGILDVLDEQKIPISYISACSSSSIIAASYASGCLGHLKEKYLKMTKQEIWDFFEPSFKGGVFSLDPMTEFLSDLIPFENIEDLKIPIAIIASDLVEGVEVSITMGNIMRAIKASCAYPGIFEPVIWGNRVLIDGGLFSNIPAQAAVSLGSDIVLGVDISPMKNNFSDRFLKFKSTYDFLISNPIRRINHLNKRIFGEKQRAYEDMTINELRSPHFLRVIDQAAGYALVEKHKISSGIKNEEDDVDIMLRPDILQFDKIDPDHFMSMYEEGRRSMTQALPQLKKLLGINE